MSFNFKTIIVFVLVLIFLQGAISFVWDIVKVDSREIAVITNQGRVESVLGAGWHLKTPYLSKHQATYDISTQSLSVEADAGSKDQQVVKAKINLQYQLKADKAKEIFLKIGGSGNGGVFKDDRIVNIIKPSFQESIKTATAKYSAVELLSQRENVKNDIISNLKERLNDYYIDVLAVNVEDINFSDQFDQAIENKVIAQQKAEQSKFELEQEKANLEKEKVKVEGLNIRGEALKNNPAVLEEQKIQKWDGRLPQVQGNNGGIIIDLKN